MIKTSIGSPTANSYIGVASANSYFERRNNSDAWIKISQETSNTTTIRTTKEKLLIQATRELDRTYNYYGSKWNQGLFGDSDYQRLHYPTTQDVLSNGTTLYVPEDIQIATCEQAYWLLERTTSRKTEDGTIVNRPIVGSLAYDYLAPYVNRTVGGQNCYPWQ